MSEWFTLETVIAFILGVLLSVAVKGFASSAKSKVGL
jgi:hypothetical protein